MTTLRIVKTAHYKKFHERFVPWSSVVETIFTGKQRKKGKDFIEFRGRKLYVLCKRDKKRHLLKVINAKKEG
jgi:hypothetical protein